MITHIGHTAYVVSDIERSLDFYCGKLGLRESFRLYNDAGELWIIYILVGQGGFVELFPAKPFQQGPSSYQHLCLAVDDMDRTLGELAGRGLPIEGEASRGKDGNRQYWITDPDGNRIELMEMAPDSLQAKAIGNGA
jgi:catechol 2,3-dioxygenase-like lactoylglutathione lyase family enzyme